jgi:hypothetical protein
VPTLAAPAFVAALYGDRVQSVFLVRDRLLAVIDLVIQEHDPFAGRDVRDAAAEYRLLPAAVLPANHDPEVKQLATTLAAGDRIVGLIALPDLERLLRRQPAHAPEPTQGTPPPS